MGRVGGGGVVHTEDRESASRRSDEVEYCTVAQLDAAISAILAVMALLERQAVQDHQLPAYLLMPPPRVGFAILIFLVVMMMRCGDVWGLCCVLASVLR